MASTRVQINAQPSSVAIERPTGRQVGASPAAPPVKGLHRRAFTLVELMTVLAILAVLFVLLMPALHAARGKVQRVQCSNKLRQIGVAFHIWAHEHQDRFPGQASTNVGGTLELATANNASFVYRTFQALANELQLPDLLVCPADRRRFAAPSFAELHNTNVSYLVNTKAAYETPRSVIATDRNLRTSGRMDFNSLQFSASDAVEWSSEIHGYRGNVLFADAHIEDVAAQSARRLIGDSMEAVLVRPEPSDVPMTIAATSLQPASPGDINEISAITPALMADHSKRGSNGVSAVPARLADAAGQASSPWTPSTPADPLNPTARPAAIDPPDGAERATRAKRPALAPTTARSGGHLSMTKSAGRAEEPQGKGSGLLERLSVLTAEATYALVFLLLGLVLWLVVQRRRRKRREKMEHFPQNSC